MTIALAPITFGTVAGLFVQVGKDIKQEDVETAAAKITIFLFGADADTRNRVALTYASASQQTAVVVNLPIALVPDATGNVQAMVPVGQYDARIYLADDTDGKAVKRFPVTVTSEHTPEAPLDLATEIPYHVIPDASTITPTVVAEIKAAATAVAGLDATVSDVEASIGQSVQLATQKAQDASDSAIAAHTSELNAQGSASAAATTATGVASAVQVATGNATAAATTAGQKAQDASDSATAAHTSELNAANSLQSAQTVLTQVQAIAGQQGNDDQIAALIAGLQSAVSVMQDQVVLATAQTTANKAAIDAFNALEAQRDWNPDLTFDNTYAITQSNIAIPNGARIAVSGSTAMGINTLSFVNGDNSVASTVSIAKPTYNTGSDYGLNGTYLATNGDSYTISQSGTNMPITYRQAGNTTDYFTAIVAPHGGYWWDSGLTFDGIYQFPQPGGNDVADYVHIFESGPNGFKMEILDAVQYGQTSRGSTPVVVSRPIYNHGDFNMAGTYDYHIYTNDQPITLVQSGNTLLATITGYYNNNSAAVITPHAV